MAVRRDALGWTIWLSDAPTGEPQPDDCLYACLDCMVDRHPGLKDGLALAQQGGAAEVVNGVWAARQPT